MAIQDVLNVEEDTEDVISATPLSTTDACVKNERTKRHSVYKTIGTNSNSSTKSQRVTAPPPATSVKPESVSDVIQASPLQEQNNHTLIAKHIKADVGHFSFPHTNGVSNSVSGTASSSFKKKSNDGRINDLKTSRKSLCLTSSKRILKQSLLHFSSIKSKEENADVSLKVVFSG